MFIGAVSNGKEIKIWEKQKKSCISKCVFFKKQSISISFISHFQSILTAFTEHSNKKTTFWTPYKIHRVLFIIQKNLKEPFFNKTTPWYNLNKTSKYSYTIIAESCSAIFSHATESGQLKDVVRVFICNLCFQKDAKFATFPPNA